MTKIGICADSEDDLSDIMTLLLQYQRQHATDLSCVHFRSALALLDAVKGGDFDLILLDVLMPGLNGMQAAHEIRNIDQNVKLLFLCASPAYAVESYSVDAFNYLLKPVKADALFALLDKALADLTRQNTAGMVIKSKEGVFHLPFFRIEYVEIMGKTVGFHLIDGSVAETFGTLSTYEPTLLLRNEFVKVHRSYLVNLTHVETLERQTLTTHIGHTLPVARTFSSQVKKNYLRFLSETKSAFASPPLDSPDSPTLSPTGIDNCHILLIEDDHADRTRRAEFLHKKGCRVSCALNTQEAQELLSLFHFDCTVLAVHLPGEDSFSLYRSLQEATGAPVVFLSHLADTEPHRKEISCGAANVLSKKAPLELFWSKLEGVICSSKVKQTSLCFKPMVLDQNKRMVLMENELLPFTPTEFALLWVLSEHAGQIFSSAELYHTVWGECCPNNGLVVQSHMSRIRHKLEKAYPTHNFIETVWGQGYCFIPNTK